jgi:hypothetical protein
MKAAPLLVSWHNENAPIYSAHFEPHGKGRLATAGGDNNVRVSDSAAGGFMDTLLIAAALEGGSQRGGAKGQLSVDPRQTYAGCQCCTMVS